MFKRRKKIKLNSSAEYSKILKKSRNVDNITIYGTVTLRDVLPLATSRIINEKSTLWTQGSKMWKIAADNYGDGRLYWIIGLYNEKPTDAHWQVGDIVYIPFPLEAVMKYLN